MSSKNDELISLNALAKEWGCIEEDILQYGIDGRLRIYLNVASGEVQVTNAKNNDISYPKKSTPAEMIEYLDELRDKMPVRQLKGRADKEDSAYLQTLKTYKKITISNNPFREDSFNLICFVPTILEKECQYLTYRCNLHGKDPRDINFSDISLKRLEASNFFKLLNRQKLYYHKITTLAERWRVDKLEILQVAINNGLRMWAHVKLLHVKQKLFIKEQGFAGFTREGIEISLPGSFPGYYEGKINAEKLNRIAIESDRIMNLNECYVKTNNKQYYLHTQFDQNVYTFGYELLQPQTIVDLHSSNGKIKVSEFDIEDRGEIDRTYVERYVAIKNESSSGYRKHYCEIGIDDLYIREDEIEKYRDKRNNSNAKSNGQGKAGACQEDKLACRQLAKKAWEEDPTRTIASIITNELSSYKRKYIGVNTLRDWIKDLDPRPKDKKSGRPRKKH